MSFVKLSFQPLFLQSFPYLFLFSPVTQMLGFWYCFFKLGFLSASGKKICQPGQERWVWSQGAEDTLGEEMATHSNILAWEIPWMVEPGGLHNPMGCKELDTPEHTHITPSSTKLRSLSFHSFIYNLFNFVSFYYSERLISISLS